MKSEAHAVFISHTIYNSAVGPRVELQRQPRWQSGNKRRRFMNEFESFRNVGWKIKRDFMVGKLTVLTQLNGKKRWTDRRATISIHICIAIKTFKTRLSSVFQITILHSLCRLLLEFTLTFSSSFCRYLRYLKFVMSLWKDLKLAKVYPSFIRLESRKFWNLPNNWVETL